MDRLRYLLKLAWIAAHTHPYVEFTDTGTAAFFIEYDHDVVGRMRVG